MKITFIDLLFLLSFLLLFFLPRKSEKYKLFWIIPLSVFLINFGIRIHLINQKHDNSDTISNQQNEITELKTEADEAKKTISKLQEQIKPRFLTEEQATYLFTLIKDKSPGDIWLSCKGTDPEACQFAQQVFKVLRAANWNIINGNVMTSEKYSSTGSTAGIIITINRELKSIPVGIDSFNKTMLKFGFASRIRTSTKNSIEIWIGAKPQNKNT